MKFRVRRGENERIVAHLEKIAQKIKLQYHGARGVEISVLQATASGDVYAIEFAKNRVSRRVIVEERTVARLLAGTPDLAQVRELRSPFWLSSRAPARKTRARGKLRQRRA